MKTFGRNILFASLILSSACNANDTQTVVDAGTDATVQADAATAPRDWTSQAHAHSRAVGNGVRVDDFAVVGATPPSNPETSNGTPESQNMTRVFRYRADTEEPTPAFAFVIAYPGFLGGAGSFDALAKALVEESVANARPIEVWAIDRRSNALEDTRAMQTAEIAENPEIAHDYYFGEDTLDGELFAGVMPQSELDYMSEWGLATHVEDLHRVIALVPEGSRRSHVYLMGHSLGASFAESYAAWRFDDGSTGDEELAGLVLIDGSLSSDPISETDFTAGSNIGGFPSPGIDEIRSATRYIALPILGVEAVIEAEVLAMRALVSPSDVIRDSTRSRLYSTLLSLPQTLIPRMTNLAGFAFGFDARTSAITIFSASLGDPTGGPLESYESLLGSTVERPSDAAATYDWIDAFDTDPPEFTPVSAFAKSFAEGPSNFAEWYFPARLSLDLSAVGGAAVGESSWQADTGLRVFDGALIDAPILCIATELRSAANYEAVRERVAQTIGVSRPNAGALRNSQQAFQVLDVPAMTHLDPVTSPESEQNPIPEAVLEFLATSGSSTAIVIDAQ